MPVAPSTSEVQEGSVAEPNDRTVSPASSPNAEDIRWLRNLEDEYKRFLETLPLRDDNNGSVKAMLTE